MDYKKLENILLCILLLIVAGVYLYTVAPTLSFWDCGEFIASAYTLAVPHPPGTPLYVLLGRVWLIALSIIAAILPISKEVAWHMNLLGLGFSVLTIFLLYKMMLRIFRMFFKKNNELQSLIIAFATCLGIAFFYTYWENAIETEVYAASTFIFILINYLALLWYETIQQGTPKNKYLLLSFYLIFLSTGIHLIPFLIFIPFYIFIFIVERRYLKDTLLLLLGIFQFLFFSVSFLLPSIFFTPIIIILGLILLTALVLPLNNPGKYKNWRFFWASVFLIVAAMSAELYLPLRAINLTELYKEKAINQRYLAGENIAPRINECNPGEKFYIGSLFDFSSSYNSVLHRGQYGSPRLIPRQTQDQTGFSLIEGYFWQMHLFVRYLLWQPIPEGMNRHFRALVISLFCIFGIWGMIEFFKRDKKLFLFTVLIMFMLSFAMVGYLNLKFSPSDPNPKHVPQEVRERDYFFHTGHVYFGIFIGFGFLGFIEWLKKETKNKNIVTMSALSGVVVFSVIPLFANIHVNNRYGNFIPKDYGYNMLVSCYDNAILFTNGDNDTFPLWFAQEVLGIKRNVIVANLSLINTNWYIKQLKSWGVPINFSDYTIDRLMPIMTRDRRVIYVKDIMVRHIIATNGQKKLNNEDYYITQEEFAKKYIKDYSGKRPIYFASTVSPENYEGFQHYLNIEGIVYRVVGDSSDPQKHVNIKQTENLFYNTYRYTGLFGPEAQAFLSNILIDFAKRKQAGEFYNFALTSDEDTRRLYTNYATGLINLGIVKQVYGKHSAAVNAWKFALLFDIPPINRFVYYNLGILHAQKDMTDSAEYYFAKAKIKEPKMLMRIGLLYRALRKYDEAINYFQKAIDVNPGFPEAYFGLYSTYIRKNDTNSAIQILYQWLKLHPRDTTVVNMIKELQEK